MPGIQCDDSVEEQAELAPNANISHRRIMSSPIYLSADWAGRLRGLTVPLNIDPDLVLFGGAAAAVYLGPNQPPRVGRVDMDLLFQGTHREAELLVDEMTAVRTPRELQVFRYEPFVSDRLGLGPSDLVTMMVNGNPVEIFLLNHRRSRGEIIATDVLPILKLAFMTAQSLQVAVPRQKSRLDPLRRNNPNELIKLNVADIGPLWLTKLIPGKREKRENGLLVAQDLLSNGAVDNAQQQLEKYATPQLLIVTRRLLQRTAIELADQPQFLQLADAVADVMSFVNSRQQMLGLGHQQTPPDSSEGRDEPVGIPDKRRSLVGGKAVNHPDISGTTTIVAAPFGWIVHARDTWEGSSPTLLPVEIVDKTALLGRLPPLDQSDTDFLIRREQEVAAKAPFNEPRVLPVGFVNRPDGSRVLQITMGRYSDVIAARELLRDKDVRATRRRFLTTPSPTVHEGHIGFGMIVTIQTPDGVTEMVMKRRNGPNEGGVLGASVDEGITWDDLNPEQTLLDIAKIARRGLVEEMMITTNRDLSQLTFADGTTTEANFQVTGAVTCLDTGGYDFSAQLEICVEDSKAAEQIRSSINNGMQRVNEQQAAEVTRTGKGAPEHNGIGYWMPFNTKTIAGIMTENWGLKKGRNGTHIVPGSPGYASYALAPVIAAGVIHIKDFVPEIHSEIGAMGRALRHPERADINLN